MRRDAEVPVADANADSYVVCVGSFQDFYGVLLEPGGEGTQRSLWNAVNFVEVARGQPGVTVSVEYGRGAGARDAEARDDDESDDDIETMSEWLLSRANGLLQACDNFGSGRTESTGEINAEVNRIDGLCRELSAVGDLFREREALQETLFSDDPCGLLDLAISTNERVRLSLELFRVRKTALALAHRAVNHIMARDFHIAVLYQCGRSLRGDERAGVLRGFQRTLAKHSARQASRQYAEIKAVPLDRAPHPVPEGQPGERPGNEIAAYARLLDRSAVSDDFVTEACGELSDGTRAALAGVVERIFRDFVA